MKGTSKQATRLEGVLTRLLLNIAHQAGSLEHPSDKSLRFFTKIFSNFKYLRCVKNDSNKSLTL